MLPMYAGSVHVENNSDNETSNHFSSGSCHAVALQGRAHVLATSSSRAQAAAAVADAAVADAAAAVVAAAAAQNPRASASDPPAQQGGVYPVYSDPRKEKAKRLGQGQGRGEPTGVWDDPRIHEFS